MFNRKNISINFFISILVPFQQKTTGQNNFIIEYYEANVLWFSKKIENLKEFSKFQTR